MTEAAKSGSGGKILVGCMVAGALVTVVGGVGLFFGAKWFAGKAKETMQELSPVDLPEEAESGGIVGALKKVVGKADPRSDARSEGARGGGLDDYEPPAGGVMDEDRLKVFLDVRRDIVAMYKSFEGRAKELDSSKSADFLKGMKGIKMLADMKKKHRATLKDKGMSESEYAWYAGTVYGALVGKAAGLMEKDGGRTIAEGLAAMTELMDNGDLTDKQRAELDKSKDRLAKLGKKAQEYPKENLALIEKYKLDIKELHVPALDSMIFTSPKAWKHAFPFKDLAGD